MVLSANSFTGDPQRGIGLGMIGPLRAGRVSARQELATSQGRDRDGPPARAKDLPDVRRAGARRGENSPLLRTQIRRCGREAGIANRS